RRCARPAVLCLALLGAGCAALATRTPTPAARISDEQLVQVPRPPNERWYLLLFGSNDQTRRPAYTHTWATLVRAVETPGCAEPALEVHTISWLPVTLEVRTLNFRPEPAENVELHAMIANALRT